MTIDLSDVGAQVPGYFNSGDTAGRSAAQVAFKCLTTPTLYPINDGSFSPLEIVLPPGRVISAVKPAAMRLWMTIPMTVVDTVFRAMAQCVPERTIAGHHADLCSATFYGVNPQHRTLLHPWCRRHRRRLRREVQRGRDERDRLSERRRHAQLAGRSDRIEDSGADRALRACAPTRAARAASAAGSASSAASACWRRSPSTRTPNGRCARRGDCSAARTRCRTRCRSERADGTLEDPAKHGKFNSVLLQTGDTIDHPHRRRRRLRRSGAALARGRGARRRAAAT